MASPLGAFLTPHPVLGRAAAPAAVQHRVPALGARGRRSCAAAPRRVAMVAPPLLPAAAPAVAAVVAHLPVAAVSFAAAAAAAPAAAATAAAATLLALTDPWSISTASADAVAAQLFAFSLFPYLAFLYYLSRPEAACPKGAFRGFAFLLVFVFATIPAGIYAKVVMGDILANVDWLHGSAESLLTITNLLIVGGFRAALAAPASAISSDSTTGASAPATPTPTTTTATDTMPSPLPDAVASGSGEALAAAVIAAGVVGIALAGGTSAHVEPGNALSLPTWAIHVSSVAEWLLAMGLAWRYAATSGNEAWKGLAWGMVPLHASGIAACVFHAAYNAPAVGGLVALQAGLTVVGNTTCAFAAFRVARRGRELAAAAEKFAPTGAAVITTAPAAASPIPSALPGVEAPAVFWAKVVGGSFAGAAVVKWGELWLDGAFHPTLPVAVAAVVVPTIFNAASWAARGAREEAAATAAAGAAAGGVGGQP